MKYLLLLPGLLALAACSGKPPTPTAQPAAASSRVTTPWDAMKADEQKAKDVQKMADKQAEEQRKQIEAQSQ